MARDWLSGAEICASASIRMLRPNSVFVACEPGDCHAGINAIDGGVALVLTHKRAPAHSILRTRSAARFAAESPEFLQWDTSLSLSRRAEKPFEGLSIVVEDASPDTCLALVALARRARGEPVPPAWIDYADRWESGDTSTTGLPESSWGALHQALVHPLLGGADLGPALTTGCLFAEGLIAAEADPAQINDAALSEHTRALLPRARSLLHAERALADHVAEIGDVVQFALEVPDTDRHRLVDGVILTEEQLTSTLKVFLRGARTSPSGQGYVLLALHRPLLRGTGNDMTFSVDPNEGVWLRNAWHALERAEWRAWGADRPQDAPRAIASYSRADLPDDIAKCNQPWYDGGPIYTLLGAPRAVAERTHGSRLSWREALGAVWGVTSPVVYFDLRDRASGARVNVIEGGASFRKPLSDSAEVFVCDFEVGPDADQTILIWSETVARTIAAFLALGRAPADRLPAREEYDVVRGRGGAIVISRHGLAIVNIAYDEAFPADEIAVETRKAAGVLAAAVRLEARLELTRSEAAAAVATGSSKRKTRALGMVYSILREAVQKSAPLPARSSDTLIALIQEKLEARWSARDRFNAALVEARELRDMIVHASDVRTNEIVHAVAIYGFPFALLNLFAFALDDASSPLQTWTIYGVHLLPVTIWIAGGAALAFTLHLWAQLRNRGWRNEIERNPEAD